MLGCVVYFEERCFTFRAKLNPENEGTKILRNVRNLLTQRQGASHQETRNFSKTAVTTSNITNSKLPSKKNCTSLQEQHYYVKKGRIFRACVVSSCQTGRNITKRSRQGTVNCNSLIANATNVFFLYERERRSEFRQNFKPSARFQHRKVGNSFFSHSSLKPGNNFHYSGQFFFFLRFSIIRKIQQYILGQQPPINSQVTSNGTSAEHWDQILIFHGKEEHYTNIKI